MALAKMRNLARKGDKKRSLIGVHVMRDDYGVLRSVCERTPVENPNRQRLQLCA
jgi:hypothetical protein